MLRTRSQTYAASRSVIDNQRVAAEKEFEIIGVEEIAQDLSERLDLRYDEQDLAFTLAEFCIAEDLEPSDLNKTLGMGNIPGSHVEVSTVGGGHAWVVCVDYDTAEELAASVVQEMLLEDSGAIDISVLAEYADVSRLRAEMKRQIVEAMLDDLEDVLKRSDIKDLVYMNREYGLDIDDESYSGYGVDDDDKDFGYDYDDGDLDGFKEAIRRAYPGYAEEIADDELRDPIGWVMEHDSRSKETIMKFVDVDDTARKMVADDGPGRWLAGDDQHENRLPSGGVYFRSN